MKSIPAFVGKRDVQVSVPTIGAEVSVDIAFGGMWFVIVRAELLGLEIRPECGAQLARVGEMIKVATREQSPVSHPTMDYPGPDILVWTSGSGLTRTNTVVMSNKELVWDNPDTHSAMLDRSPCGSGTAAVMAWLHDKGELGLGEELTHRSVLGTEFRGELEDTVVVTEDILGVKPVIRGRGWI